MLKSSAGDGKTANAAAYSPRPILEITPQSLGRSNPDAPSTYALTSRPTLTTLSLLLVVFMPIWYYENTPLMEELCQDVGFL